MTENTDTRRRPRKEKPQPKLRRKFKGIAWLPVWLMLAGYFVWLCSQMAGEAPNGIGGGSLLGILVAVVAGLVAAGLALGVGRGERD